MDCQRVHLNRLGVCPYTHQPSTGTTHNDNILQAERHGQILKLCNSNLDKAESMQELQPLCRSAF